MKFNWDPTHSVVGNQDSGWPSRNSRIRLDKDDSDRRVLSKKSQIHWPSPSEWKCRNDYWKWWKMLEQQALCHTQLQCPLLSGHQQQHMHSPLSPTSRILLFSHTSHSLSPNGYNSETLYARKSEIPNFHILLDRLGMDPKSKCKYQRNWSERENAEEGRSNCGVELQGQPLWLCSCCSWLPEHGILQSADTTP